MAHPITSRGALGITGALLAGGVSAAFFAVALMNSESMLIFLAYLAAVPLFVAGLGAGVLAGVTASATGMASLAVVQPSNLALLYAIINAVPAMALIAFALRYRVGSDGKTYWYPEGYLLMAITLYPCILFLMIFALVGAENGGLLALTTQFVNEALEAMREKMPPEAFIQFEAAMSKLVKLLPALAGCTWIFITMVSMIVAQTVLEQQKWNLRTAFSLRNLQVPNWVIFAAAATGLMGAMAPEPFDYIGANLAIILGIPFFFAGLAVTHAWAETQKTPKLILVAFYLVMGVFPGVMLFAALLGALDQWFNFRRHFVPRVNKSV